LTLYRIQEKARAEVASGEYDKASMHLQKLATHLLADGERNLAHTILLEVEHVEREKAFSEPVKNKSSMERGHFYCPGSDAYDHLSKLQARRSRWGDFLR